MREPTNPNFCIIDGCTNRTHSKKTTRCGKHLSTAIMVRCAVDDCKNEFRRTQGSRRLCDDHRGVKLPRVCTFDGCSNSLPYGGRKYCAEHSAIMCSPVTRYRYQRQKQDEEGQPLKKRVPSEKEQKQASADAIRAYLAGGGAVTKCDTAINV